jgi:hypothetical protein
MEIELNCPTEDFLTDLEERVASEFQVSCEVIRIRLKKNDLKGMVLS